MSGLKQIVHAAERILALVKKKGEHQRPYHSLVSKRTDINA